MVSQVESAQRVPLGEGHRMSMRTPTTTTPTIHMSAPDPEDPMDVTTSPPSQSKSPEVNSGDDGPNGNNNVPAEPQPPNNSMTMPAPTAAAAAVHQPKIVQTAFIHKLYNMLEDQSIQHLISWSTTQESFVMAPNHDFSKVLAQYFKHTNISSFVRQLNMYGFHKVSDVFHNGSPDQPLWEFKHGNGNFKRGDLQGLREIKRRASRHSLVNREFNNQKPLSSQPGTPAEPMQPVPDVTTPGFGGSNYDYNMHEILARLDRSETNAQFMHVKYQAVLDSVTRLLHFNQELTRSVLSLAHDEHPSHRDRQPHPIVEGLMNLQDEIQRQSGIIHALNSNHDNPLPSGRQYFANVDNAPLSPHHLAQDDNRRSNSLAVPQSRGAYNYRPQVPSNLSINTRRGYGSIGGSTMPVVNVPTTQSSPSSLRPQIAPPPPTHPLPSEAHPGSLVRRHTSADIRGDGWQPNQHPYASGPPSSLWPSSPNRLGVDDRDARLRDDLSHYSLQGASQPHSRPPSPPNHGGPPSTNGGGLESLNNWSWGTPSNRDRRNLGIFDNSAPPTRRGSMAHILNPTDTAGREGEFEDDPRGDDDRKRKRLI